MADKTSGQSVRQLATKPFWLDGGYDRESVEACPYHPAHRWWTFRLGDVIEPDRLREIEAVHLAGCNLALGCRVGARVAVVRRLEASLQQGDPLLACPQVAIERRLDLGRGVQRPDLVELLLGGADQRAL